MMSSKNVGPVPPLFEGGILILEALEAVDLAVESSYERFIKTEREEEDEHRSGVDET